jgi:hypothetical protein
LVLTKLDKLLVQIKRQKIKTLSLSGREKEHHSLVYTDRTVRGHRELLHVDRLSFDEMDTFPAKVMQKKIENQNSLLSIKEVEFELR